MNQGISQIGPKHLYGLLAIIALVLAVYAYLDTLEGREPVFVADPLVTSIFVPNLSNTPAFYLHEASGERITDPVSAQTGYFWNRGELPVNPEHVLSPMTLTLDGGTILEARLTSMSRPVYGPTISVNDDRKSIDIGFRTLAHNDGFVIQVIYKGSIDATLTMDGDVEGAVSIESTSYSKAYAIARAVGIAVLIMIAALGILTLVVRPIFDWVFERFSKENEIITPPGDRAEVAAQRRATKTRVFVRDAFLTVVVGAVILAIASWYIYAYEGERSILLRNVPVEIFGH